MNIEKNAMKKIKIYFLGIILMISAVSCFEDRDDNITLNSNTLEINDFVWKGMNEFYLFGNDVPDLRNERFGLNGLDNRYETTPEYLEYLSEFTSPENLFEALVFDAGNTDRFSVIFPDLFQAIAASEGTTETTGLRLFIYNVPGSDTEVFARVSMVLNGSNADLAGVRRNMVISGVDGTTLTTNNFQALLLQDTATLNFADYNDNGTETIDDDTITPNGQSITVSRAVFTDNPVHRTEVLNISGQTIGYLMYNSFLFNFETELNNAFGELLAANVQHLVLDLRYNRGGAIVTAARLASMITGQFNGQLLATNINGPNRQDQNRDFNFTNTINSGGAINSLNLSKVYILTSEDSASASELIINSLRPYGIDVVLVGTTTRGKASSNLLIFDSPDFGRTQVTAAHTYALFPLIGEVLNKDGDPVSPGGFAPDIEVNESQVNLGILGDPDEPLLAAAIADITGTGRISTTLSNSNGISNRLELEDSFNILDGYMYFK